MQIKHLNIAQLVKDITDDDLVDDPCRPGVWLWDGQEGLTDDQVLKALGLNGEWRLEDMEEHYKGLLPKCADRVDFECYVISAIQGNEIFLSDRVVAALEYNRAHPGWGPNAPYFYMFLIWQLTLERTY